MFGGLGPVTPGPPKSGPGSLPLSLLAVAATECVWSRKLSFPGKKTEPRISEIV